MYFPEWFLKLIVYFGLFFVGCSVPFLIFVFIKEIKDGTAY